MSNPIRLPSGGTYRTAGRRHFDTGRMMSAQRADLEQFAVVAGFPGNAELAAAIEAGHDRHHGHDGLALALRERVTDAGLLAELDQVARGRERKLETPAL